METVLLISGLFVVGTAVGSFVGAQVWRERARQLKRDKRDHYDYDAKELKRLDVLLGKTIPTDRSLCLSCHHTLRWYDLIPLLSWTMTGGRCRYCRIPIGWFEPMIEVGTGVLFALSFILWPHTLSSVAAWTEFVLWLVACVPLVFLFAYDYKWQILPLTINRLYIVLALAVVAVRALYTPIDWWSFVLSVFLLGGLYGLLYLISKQWVGDADWILGTGLGIVLADWRQAFIALFTANLIGCVMVLPGLINGRMQAKTAVPLGPLLIIGMLIAFFGGDAIAQWFLSQQWL